MQRASFGAGCFWGTDKFFRKEFPKLKSCYTGYLGGSKPNPSYEDVGIVSIHCSSFCTGVSSSKLLLEVNSQDDFYTVQFLVAEELC